MAIMIVYDVHIYFCMSPLVKGSLVVVLSLVLRVSRFKKRKDQNPFRFLLSYRARNVGRKGGRGFRRREEGRAIGFPFLSLPPLFAPATQVTSHSFFCWNLAVGAWPPTCFLPTHTHVRNMRVSQACGRENADRTHNVEKSENRTPRVVRITLYWLFGSFLLLCSAVYCAKVVSWSLEMTHTKLIHSGAAKDYFLWNILSETQTLPRIFCYLWTANVFLMTAPFTFWSLIFTFNFPS